MKIKAKKVLAFDFGASSGRAIIGAYEDGKIKMEEVHRFSNDPVILNGTMYWDTLRQFFEIKQGIIKAKNKVDLESIGIDTWGVDFALLDNEGNLLENAVHYRDDRTVGMQEKLFEIIPKEEVYMMTGNQFENFNTIFQLLALTKKRPEFIERADKLLMTADLFNYFLTGNIKAEYTMATTTQLLKAKERCWSDQIIRGLGVSKTLFPEIISSGTCIGTLKEDICKELKMQPLNVIAVASHDTQSAVVAVPTQAGSFVFISCGTWSLVGTEMSDFIIDKETLECNISNEGGYGGTTNLLKNISGLWLIQESRRQWIREGKEYSFGELETMARSAEPLMSFIDPSDEAYITAGDIPQRIRAFCKRTGQKIPETIGDIVRCIDQSLALKYRYSIEQLEKCIGNKYSEIHIIGGGVQSHLLCQMTADATGRKVIAGPVEATAIGNIAVQFISKGIISNLKEARKIIAASDEIIEYMPRDTGVWDQAYQHIIEHKIIS